MKKDYISGVFNRFHLINLSFGIFTVSAALTFNKFYLEYRFSRVLAMERVSPRNLISLSYVIYSAIVISISFFSINLYQLFNGNPKNPIGILTILILSSSILGCFASRLKIRLYFYQFLQQLYYSSAFLHWLTRKNQKGRIMPY